MQHFPKLMKTFIPSIFSGFCQTGRNSISGFAKRAGVSCRGLPNGQEFHVGVCQVGRSFMSGFAKSAGVSCRGLPN